jgi:hypothetical protein
MRHLNDAARRLLVRILLIAAIAAAPLTAGRPALSQILFAPNLYSQEAWKQLGAETTEIVSPKLTAVEVTMSCGRYTELEASYSNGMVESKEIPGDDAIQTKLGNLFAVNSAIVSIVEQPCME